MIAQREGEPASTGRLVAGVDSSTQSCKVELRLLPGGELRASASHPHPPASPPSSEQNPQAWWDAFVAAFRAAMEQAGVSGAQIAGISVAAQCHGLVPLDEQMQVLRPAKLWNDTTSASHVEQLRRQIGDQLFIERVGSLPTSAFTLGKLAWLAEKEPDAFDALHCVLLPHDYLTWRLTGARVTDRSEASGTGYFDARAGEYLYDVLETIDDGATNGTGKRKKWEQMLPTVLGPDQSAGTLRPEALAELGLEEAQHPVIVGPGGGDQHLSAVGLGIAPGDVVYSFGTSGVVFGTQVDSVQDPQGHVNGVADCLGGYLPLVCTLNASRVLDTFCDLLAVDHAGLSDLALAASPQSNGPVLAAYLDGERTPDRPRATGILAGLTNNTTREELARAVYEGVVLGLVTGQEHLERVGVSTRGRTIAVGGGARSQATVQLLADVLGKTVLSAETTEPVARGAAVQAAAVVQGRTVREQARLWAPHSWVSASPRETRREVCRVYRSLAQVDLMDGIPMLEET